MGKSNQELKYKRLKVGHACYVCRSKKIKCDGLRPCMQCKARGRHCVSSKEELLAYDESCKDPLESSGSSISGTESDDDSILFSKNDKSLSNLNACSESWTSHAAMSIADNIKPNIDYPLFGDFVRWTVEPPLPSYYSHPIEMPTVDIQMHLIDLFFKTHHKNMPIIPKAFFYDQLHIKGPFITPLLLNAIYCTVSAQSSLPDVPKPTVFFNRCKKLVDDFLDTPRLSTVIALCLLSNYESIPTRVRSENTQHCRSWIYGGMAFRMCLELGLNVDTEETRKLLCSQDIEIRRRVFWLCYILDKLQSREWERSWSLPSSLSNVAFPTPLPTEDPEDHNAILAFTHFAKLAIIAEEGLQIRSLYAISGKINLETIYGQLEQYSSSIFLWIQQSASLGANHSQDAPFFVRNRLIAHFMWIETSLLLPQTLERANLQSTCASELISCANTISSLSYKVIHYEVLAHAVGTALRVQMRIVKENSTKSDSSHELVGTCLEIFNTIQQRAAIPKFSQTVRQINSLYQSSRKAQQQETKKQKDPQCDQGRTGCVENQPEAQMTTNNVSCPTQSDENYQPWLQSLQDTLPLPLTPEDTMQMSNLSSPDHQSEQLWAFPYLPESAFPSDNTCQQSLPYFNPVLSSYPDLYVNNSYNYLVDPIDCNAQNVQSPYQQLYYTHQI